jgi:hypothetical protein
MRFLSTRLVGLFLLLPASVTVMASEGPEHQAAVDVEDAFIRLAADRIDAVFGELEQSIKALGAQYTELSRTATAPTGDEQSRWRAGYRVKQGTVQFRTWSSEAEAPPGYQSPYPDFYSYGGESFSDRTFRQLDIFERLAGAFRVAYETFQLSWVYFTGVDEMFMIYPFMTLEEAVNNNPPTKQVYYTAADFKNRGFGWTPPYLDLVGAGMMITVSWPVYDGDTLLGVMSRDVTLKQLSDSVLGHLAATQGATAFIMDSSGLLIAVSDAKLDTELEHTNQKAGRAVLYYRSNRGIRTLVTAGAVNSGSQLMNRIAEEVIGRSGEQPDSVLRFAHHDHRVLATRTSTTGWFLVLVLPG